MWTAKVTDKSFVNGVFSVTVAYTNGKETFSDVIDMTGGSPEVLSQKVTTKLNTLNATVPLVDAIVLGDVPPFVQPAPDPLDAARRALATANQDAELGIIQKIDKVYIDALDAAQAAYTSTAVSEIVSKQSTVL